MTENKAVNNAAEIKKQLEETKEKCEEYLNGWKRERADFLNYKKEEMERISELIKYANEELILKMLPILDNIDIAEKNLTAELKNNDWLKGFINIKSQILDFLKGQGIEPIETIGRKFDPNFHEVVEEIEDKNAEHGIIIEEVRKGYLFAGRVLRPAKVKIAK